MAGSKAIKLIDNKEDYTEANFNEDTMTNAAIQTDVSIEANAEKGKRLDAEDMKLMAEYNEKLDKVKLNIGQGEFGRALAETKLQDIKLIFAQI